MGYRADSIPAIKARAKAAQKLYNVALSNKYKPNPKATEIIGLMSASFTHITTDSVPGSLTQTTFDTTSRADSAQILLTNSTGVTRTIIAAWIRGKAVTRMNDPKRGYWQSYGSPRKYGPQGGFIHDKHVDYELQARDGDVTFELGNNFIINADQVNKLADYHWKLNRVKKHIYTLNLAGFQSWYEPGEWYTLQIGGVGEEEYIDSTVECFDVRCSIGVGGAPYTSVSFREVEESWKFDSNEVARMIASGGFNRRPSQTSVTVAAQYYPGYADLYCDGDDDQEEINNAIAYLGQSGGGDVCLSKGTFNITSSLTPASKVNIYGEGASTVLYASASALTRIIYWNSSATSIEDININNLKFDRMASLPNDTQNYIYIYKAESVCVSNNLFSKPYGNAISLYGNGISVINNIVDGELATAATVNAIIVGGLSATGRTNIVSQNKVYDIIASGFSTIANAIFVSNDGYIGGVVVSNNAVDNIVNADTDGSAYGIRIAADGILLSSNDVRGVKNTATAAYAWGYYIDSGATNTIMNHNLAYNNGADTGLANTNLQNFKDEGTGTQWAG